MMTKYIKIEPVEIPNFEESKIANAIMWYCEHLVKGATSVSLICNLGFVNDEESISTPLHTFQMIVPSEVLDNWLDDSVIDDYVLTYSKKFIKA